MAKVLGSAFFNRPTLTVARELLGKFLVRRVGGPSTKLGAGKTVAFMIVETEAYDGPKDKACHASRGQTARNTPMFSEAGTVYVYFTYGMHWMLNLVCGKQGYPAAVLIRGLKSSTTTARRAALRAARPSLTAHRTVLALPKLNGPAKLTKFLKIDRSLNHKPLGKKTGLWVEDRGVKIPPRDIARTPRIGIHYAEEYADKPWRFVIKSK